MKLFDLVNALSLCMSASTASANVLIHGRSNITATECGQGALVRNQTCPLNVCCSAAGYCGTTADFCGVGCQSNCEPVAETSCNYTSPKRTIGYYESWASTRTCQSVSPAELNVTGYTHINYAFMLFDPVTFAITSGSDNDTSLLSSFVNLKTTNPGLQAWVAVGGWNFNEPGPTFTAFSDMVGCPENRTKFVNEITSFMDTHGFDGLDLDWEYPSVTERGGKPADTENYALLIKDLRAAFDARYGLSVTLPASYFYMQHFDVSAMEEHVDFFNIMTYDLHGVWDKDTEGVGPYIRSHTGLDDISVSLNLLWGAGIAREKVNMGMALYGRGFVLKDSNCTTPDGSCQFTNASLPGPCSGAEGTLNLAEIQDVIVRDNLTPTYDFDNAFKYIVYNKTQWVAYDDADTIALKQFYARVSCLGGTMVWVMDQADQESFTMKPAVRQPVANASYPLESPSSSGVVATSTPMD